VPSRRRASRRASWTGRGARSTLPTPRATRSARRRPPPASRRRSRTSPIGVVASLRRSRLAWSACCVSWASPRAARSGSAAAWWSMKTFATWRLWLC